jgi:hypothetical protein
LRAATDLQRETSSDKYLKLLPDRRTFSWFSVEEVNDLICQPESLNKRNGRSQGGVHFCK